MKERSVWRIANPNKVHVTFVALASAAGRVFMTKATVAMVGLEEKKVTSVLTHQVYILSLIHI